MGKKILMGLVLMGAMSGPGLAGGYDSQDMVDAIKADLNELLTSMEEMNASMEEMSASTEEMSASTEEMIADVREIMRLLCEKDPGSSICEAIDE